MNVYRIEYNSEEHLMFDIEEISIPMEQKLNELEDEICAWIDMGST